MHILFCISCCVCRERWARSMWFLSSWSYLSGASPSFCGLCEEPLFPPFPVALPYRESSKSGAAFPPHHLTFSHHSGWLLHVFGNVNFHFIWAPLLWLCFRNYPVTKFCSLSEALNSNIIPHFLNKTPLRPLATLWLLILLFGWFINPIFTFLDFLLPWIPLLTCRDVLAFWLVLQPSPLLHQS